MAFSKSYLFVVMLLIAYIHPHAIFASKESQPASASAWESRQSAVDTRSEKGNISWEASEGYQISHPARPQKPMYDLFWEYVLLIFGLVFLFWLGLLIAGLLVSGATAAAILLGLAAASAYLGLMALVIALIALLMIVTREERRARRRQFWG